MSAHQNSRVRVKYAAIKRGRSTHALPRTSEVTPSVRLRDCRGVMYRREDVLLHYPWTNCDTSISTTVQQVTPSVRLRDRRYVVAEECTDLKMYYSSIPGPTLTLTILE